MKYRVAVVYGGRSGEHDVSVLSAKSVMEAIDPARFEVKPFFIDHSGRWDPFPLRPEPGSNKGLDIVFPVLHGTFGEDGTVQGLLELADLPYVGAGVLGSAVCMDKLFTKRLCAQAGIPVVDFVSGFTWNAGAEMVEQVEATFGYPCFVKPANLGSSVGITKAAGRAALLEAIRIAGQFDSSILVERAIEGQELECSVLGNEHLQASVVGEIIPGKEFYDYEDKYLDGKAQTLIPARISDNDQSEVRSLAVKAASVLGVEGMARVDFFREHSSGRIFLNEVNTIPGFTNISMYGKMWAASGISYTDLISQLLDLAMERHRRRRSLKYTR